MTEVITTKKGICIIQNFHNCQNFDYGMKHMKVDDRKPKKDMVIKK